jgi:hypothetical protein
MQYLCLIYTDESADARMTREEGQAVMGEYFAFTEGIKKSGHYVGGNPLQPTKTASTVRVRQGKMSTTDGPFAETKELVAGFWLWEVKSKEEAVEWAKRCPNPTGADGVLELRQIFEPEDFGTEFTPELREKEERLRAESAAKR